MSAMDNYNIWLEKTDEQTRRELLALAGNDTEIENRFFTSLEFGTGGLRGKLGAGTFYMNKYTVGQATQGLAEYVLEKGGRSCVIGFDSRYMSREFAAQSAEIMAANGLTAYIFPTLIPTPVVSFAIRKLRADVGIMITASHNPKEYNGYKAYNSTGCQAANEEADEIYSKIKSVDIFEGVKSSGGNGEVKTVPDSVYSEYLEEVLRARVKPMNVVGNPNSNKKSKLKVLFTPLNGAGNIPVRDILRLSGIDNVRVVESQEMPDGGFPTCPYPNPEFPEAYSEAFKIAERYKPHIIIATDPDSDRLGAAVRDSKGSYVVLSGNEIGLLLLDYILKNTPRRTERVVVKTVVTTALVYRIADKYNVNVEDTLTGFKFIGEVLNRLEREGELKNYLFGFEESNGYLPGTQARDKDAVAAAMLFAEMASSALDEGLTVVEVLEQLYADYGYMCNRTLNFTFEGAQGKAEMDERLEAVRRAGITSMGGYNVASYTDYLEAGTGLPRSNMLKYSLVSGEVIIRPSGTEPKMKAYLTAISDHPEKSTAMVQALEKSVKELLKIE